MDEHSGDSMPLTQSHRSSAEAFDEHVPGVLLATSKDYPLKDLYIQMFARSQVQESIMLPAVPEPLVVWILSGTAVVEEREPGGEWKASRVTQGDFFLTNSPRPCELRWKAEGTEPFTVMHLYLGLGLVRQAVMELFNEDSTDAGLKEISGASDAVLSQLLEHLRLELTSQHRPSPLYVHGIGQSLAVHIVRQYSDPALRGSVHRGGLPAYKLKRITDLLRESLEDEFSLSRLAEEAGLSEYHFCRAFKQSTGMSPSAYFIRLRLERARRLLRETGKSIIEVGMEVGYTSPSHFAKVFRREVGVSPSSYRSAG